ncbi:NAD(P)/FAD-dependent oxidoreductase [Streptomyces odontomachi]|uniref:NAD(P)/FAD-dependent oxidoreductase n=1 Tax=Streptomyces odontomachi TaxID=2944940 RepID=UPI0021093359|nr:FAD-dependent oxidoreductase [Streptomyces sp. ODS25]
MSGGENVRGPGGTVVIVGSSIAGVRAAQALRTEGHQGRIVLVGAESELPYDKPPLSKQFLSGTRDQAGIGLLTSAEAATAGIALRLGAAATHLDPAAHRVRLADGTELGYDTCVLATGAAARPAPWLTAGGVHVLRTLGDGHALRRDLAQGGTGHVVVVGGGFIGAEVAATARRLGHDVTVVDPLPLPMARVLGPEVGAHLAALHRRHGVATRFGTGVRSVTGGTGDLRVELADGTVLAARTVVVGIGAVPNDTWLASSGLRLDDGVLCDAYCRARGVPDVFAAGDVARWYHPGHGAHVRVEHWTNAVEQAAQVAHNITHPEAMRPYAPVEYVWSDQYDFKIQIVGRPAGPAPDAPVPGDPVLIGRWEGEDARAAALYGDADGRLRAAATVNWPRALLDCRRLVAQGADLAAARTRIDRLAEASARPAPSPATSPSGAGS